MRALFGVLLTIAIAVTAGVIGFQAGVASNIAAAGGVVWLGGLPFFGLLAFLMFLGFVFFAIGGARRRTMARGPWSAGPWGGPGSWGHGADSRREWVREMHRRLHEDEASAGSQDRSADAATGSGPASA